MTYKIGITGHRKLLNKKEEVLESVKTKLRELLETRPDLEVYSGMALGFDQMACEAALSLGVPFVAIVPCDGQDSLWSDSQKARYQELLALASNVVVVSPGPYQAWKMHARNGWIVKNSDELIIHWDGYLQGGTGSCMKMAKAKPLPWFNTYIKPSF